MASAALVMQEVNVTEPLLIGYPYNIMNCPYKKRRRLKEALSELITTFSCAGFMLHNCKDP